MTRLRSEKAVLAGYAALTLYFVWAVLTTGSALGISDWDAHLFQYTSVFRSVYEYGQLPFWNPWFCGGNVLWQNPQAPLITPLYALARLRYASTSPRQVIWPSRMARCTSAIVASSS